MMSNKKQKCAASQSTMDKMILFLREAEHAVKNHVLNEEETAQFKGWCPHQVAWLFDEVIDIRTAREDFTRLAWSLADEGGLQVKRIYVVLRGQSKSNIDPDMLTSGCSHHPPSLQSLLQKLHLQALQILEDANCNLDPPADVG